MGSLEGTLQVEAVQDNTPETINGAQNKVAALISMPSLVRVQLLKCQSVN